MRKNFRLLPFVLTLSVFGALSVPGVADAIPAQLKARISAAKDDVKESKKLMKDDEKDLKEIEKIAEKWHAAWQDGNDKKKAKLDEALLEWLQEELAENREDRRRARQELERTGAEVEPNTPTRSRSSNANPQRQSPRAGGAGNAGDNPAQADARADFEAEREDARNTREVAEQLQEIQRRFNRGTAGPQVHQDKSELLRELVRSARRDLRRATRELAEDEQRLERLKDRR